MIMVKESVHQEEITIVYIHAPDIKRPKYSEQILTGVRERIIYIQYNNNRGLCIPLLTIDRSSGSSVGSIGIELYI